MSLLNLQCTYEDFVYQNALNLPSLDGGSDVTTGHPVVFLHPGEERPPQNGFPLPPVTPELLRLLPRDPQHDKMQELIMTTEALALKLIHMLECHRLLAANCTFGCQQRMVSKKMLREIRSSFKDECYAHCGKLDDEAQTILKLCARCKIVKYCSAECQRSDWVHHKNMCNRDRGKGILHLLNTMLANPFITHEISVCLAHVFRQERDLSASERLAFAREPQFAQMDVGVEPTDILDTVAIVRQVQNRTEGMEHDERWDAIDLDSVEGMLQVNYIGEMKIQDAQLREADKAARINLLKVWQERRNDFDARGMRSVPIIMLTIFNKDSYMSTMVFPIFPETVLAARHPPKYKLQARAYQNARRRVVEPMDTRLNHLNEHIRYDTKNKFLLRTIVSKRDKEIISAGVKGIREGEYSSAKCHVKMLREPIYDIIRVLGEQDLYRQMGNKLAEGDKEGALNIFRGYCRSLGMDDFTVVEKSPAETPQSNDIGFERY